VRVNDAVMACCKDEEDIIETFVRFYLAAGFDFVHIIDNGSTDRTADILAHLVDEGLSVSITFDDYLGYDRILTKWFHAIGERFSPRWLFFLDCDEFILFPDTAKVYLDRLSPKVNRLRLRIKEVYPQVDERELDSHFLLSDRLQEGFDIVTKDVTIFAPSTQVRGGKHLIDNPNPHTSEIDDIFIRHYKYRTPTQAERKERNQVAAELTHSDENIRKCSAFDFKHTKEWILNRRRALLLQEWRTNFSPSKPFVRDDTMAKWAQTFLASPKGSLRYTP
jgi:glycosyltransferase involved in cell wall biosynthesis